MDYFRQLFKGKPKQQEAILRPSRQEMFSEMVNRFTAGISYGLNSTLPDPDPILTKLGRTYTIYREVLADAKVSACIEQRKAGTTSLNWGLTAEAGQEQAAEVIETALKRLDMPRLISECLDAVLFGFQVLEIVWERRDGYILPLKVEGKPAEWFQFDNENRLRFRRLGCPDGVPAVQHKFILVQHQANYMNPYGHKLLSQCFWPVTFKRNGWRWWVTMVEKYGMPVILGKVPRGTDANEQQQFLSNLENLVQDAISVIPNDSTVEVLSGSSIAPGKAEGAHKALIDQCNAEIALALVGQTLTSEIGDTGSYAAANTHNAVRGDIMTSDKRMVEKALQTLVDWIYVINFATGDAPVFSMWHDIDIDRDLAERDQILTGTGIKFTKDYYKRMYGLEDADFDVVAPAQGAEFAEPSLKGSKKGVELPFNVDDYELDGKKLSDLGKALLAPISRLISEGNSFEQVLTEIHKLYPQMDTTSLEDALARAFYVATINGRLGKE